MSACERLYVGRIYHHVHFEPIASYQSSDGACDLSGGELRLGTLRLLMPAQSRGMSMNKLVEQISAHALAAWNKENHFRAMAATEDGEAATR